MNKAWYKTQEEDLIDLHVFDEIIFDQFEDLYFIMANIFPKQNLEGQTYQLYMTKSEDEFLKQEDIINKLLLETSCKY